MFEALLIFSVVAIKLIPAIFLFQIAFKLIKEDFPTPRQRALHRATWRSVKQRRKYA